MPGAARFAKQGGVVSDGVCQWQSTLRPEWWLLPVAHEKTPGPLRAIQGFNVSSGDRIRTCDLEVMSLASYRAAPPRVVVVYGIIRTRYRRVKPRLLSFYQTDHKPLFTNTLQRRQPINNPTPVAGKHRQSVHRSGLTSGAKAAERCRRGASPESRSGPGIPW